MLPKSSEERGTSRVKKNGLTDKVGQFFFFGPHLIFVTAVFGNCRGWQGLRALIRGLLCSGNGTSQIVRWGWGGCEGRGDGNQRPVGRCCCCSCCCLLPLLLLLLAILAGLVGQTDRSSGSLTSINVSRRLSRFSMSWPCSLRKVHRNRLRF